MKKKYLKYFLIIIVNLLLFFILLEGFTYLYEVFTLYNREKNTYHNSLFSDHYKYSWLNTFSNEETYKIIKPNLRPPIGLNYKNRPILLMGCSFAYGYGLQDSETFQYKLSNLTKRPVYNRAYQNFWGPATMLYQARRDDFYNEVPNPEYVIYVLIKDHLNRINSKCMYPFSSSPHLTYKLKKNRLEEDKINFLYNFYIFKEYNKLKAKLIPFDKSIDFLSEFFIETKAEFDKHWKDYKFIILVYDEDINNNFKKANWKKLKENGFTIISTYDLTGRYLSKSKDKIYDKYHPSEKAWNEITPPFSKMIK